MTISLSDAGKRFNRDWIYRHLDFTFHSGNAYAITGPNGSGKSTLLQALGAAMMLSEGTIRFERNGKPVSSDDIYREVSICAPYLELIEEMTLQEFFDFHFGFKYWLPGLDTTRAVEILGLQKALHKQIRYYSSGMKQRVKLGQCLFADTAIVLLDEPCTNLDAAGIEQYHSLVHQYTRDRLVVVSSNDEVEYRFCTERINISDYK